MTPLEGTWETSIEKLIYTARITTLEGETLNLELYQYTGGDWIFSAHIWPDTPPENPRLGHRIID